MMQIEKKTRLDRLMGTKYSGHPDNEAANRDLSAEEAFEKVWDTECEVCGASPVVRATGLCGPCTFGEADTVGGNW